MILPLQNAIAQQVEVSRPITAQQMKFPIKDFFSKCDQIRRKLRIWSHLLKKYLMENLIFCAVHVDIIFFKSPSFTLSTTIAHPLDETHLDEMGAYLTKRFQTVNQKEELVGVMLQRLIRTNRSS